MSNIIDAARQGEVIALYDLISIHQEGHLHGTSVTISDAFFGQNIVAIAEVIDSHEYGINWAYAWAAWAYAHGKGVTKSKNLAKKWINRLPIEMREGPFIKALPL